MGEKKIIGGVAYEFPEFPQGQDFEVIIRLRGEPDPVIIGGSNHDSVFVRGEVPELQVGKRTQHALNVAFDQIRAVVAARGSYKF